MSFYSCLTVQSLLGLGLVVCYCSILVQVWATGIWELMFWFFCVRQFLSCAGGPWFFEGERESLFFFDDYDIQTKIRKNNIGV